MGIGDKREEILRIAAKHGVTSIRVFGSVARGDARADSDVDFIEAGSDVAPWFPGGLVADLEARRAPSVYEANDPVGGHRAVTGSARVPAQHRTVDGAHRRVDRRRS